MLKVKKYGGTSVADKERIFYCAQKCAEEYRNGHDVIVVLSAMGKMTDELIAQAHTIQPEPSKREMDMLLTVGEQISTALFSMALETMRVPAISLNAFQAGMHATGVYGNARLTEIETDRIEHELSERKIVIVTGFQAVSKYYDYVTLGRGGSDTTAVALAAVFHADECEINTDVDGVYTADPRIVPAARKLEEITYDEMLDLATLGAGVLHNRSVEMAKKYGIKLIVRSSFHEVAGTVVRERSTMEKTLISGVAVDQNADRITVIGMKNEPGSEFRLFRLLADHGVNVDLIIQSVTGEYTKDVSFTIKDEDLEQTLELLKEKKDMVSYQDIRYNTELAKLSIVGAGMMSNPGVAAKLFECLYNEGINIGMITTSEIRITVMVKESEVVRAANAVHESFHLGGDR